MSEHAARSALTRMNLRENFIASAFRENFANDMMLMMSANVDVEQQKLEQRRHELCEAYGFSRREQNKPFAFANGVAIIPVHGTLLNRFGSSWGFVTGYNFIRSQMNAAMADDEVQTILFDVNSFGGEAAGCFELSAQIAANRGQGKKIVAYVDSNCYSAAYAVASAADKVIAIPSAGIGSVGVVCMHVDMSKFLEKIGMAVTFIHSGDHKVDGNPYEPLDKEVKADLQKNVDKSRAKFVAVVSENMGLDSKVVYDTEARTYRADDALELGLIHAIAEPTVALQSIIDDDTESDDDGELAKTNDQPKEQVMSGTENKGDNAAAAVDTAAVQKAERERCAGILSCDEAKGKTKLATHLALNTSMSLADAKAMLAVAAAETVEAAKGDEAGKEEAGKDGGGDNTGKDKAKGGNQFEQAMNKEGGAGIGADNAAQHQQQDASADILKNYTMATGNKVA
jgi:signal peptide peptidase SppA